MLANVDSVDIEVQGRGGHGASPDSTIDPIVQASELVMSLQTIVSREVKPTEPAVITVGSIHGGTKHNIIGDRCKLQITVRSYTPEVRKLLLDAIRRRANGIAAAYGAPEPKIEISEGTPALENNAALAERMTQKFQETLGAQRVLQAEQVMGGEDFSQYGLAGVPILMYRLGVLGPRRAEHYRQLNQTPPSLHSAAFYPDLEGSLETGIVSMSIAALDLLRP
jgi:hippurate hydrolase